MENLKKYITEVKDFPKKGIVYKDINPIYKDHKLWKELMLPLEHVISNSKPDYLAGIESRGFITASALAFKLEIGFIPIRKPKKLPGKLISANYKLEYGNDRLEMQINTFDKNSKVILIDDILATGGPSGAASKLIKEAGGDLIGYGFLIELTDLEGRNNLFSNLFVESILKY